jgi:hypothetical protein
VSIHILISFLMVLQVPPESEWIRTIQTQIERCREEELLKAAHSAALNVSSAGREDDVSRSVQYIILNGARQRNQGPTR